MSQFTAINLALIPAPQVIEVIDYEQVLAEMLADLAARLPEFDTFLESDPVMKLLEVAAYRETVLRQRINEAAKAVMLSYAMDTDLDQLGATFGVTRLEVTPADPDASPPTAAVFEKNSDFRYRIQLSLEGLSTAGPEGAYIFHALSADGLVLDASAISPTPGEVLVTVLSRDGDGTASAELLAAVEASLSAEDVRPLTDFVQVQGATIVPYQVEAALYFYAGPDRTVIMATAQAAIEAYTESQHRLGLDVTLSGIYAALHQPGVQRVELTEPAATLVIDRQSASYCTAIALTDGGLDE
ncbi:baseplate J/gp47 family protein [Pseudomonas sp. SA3-5]|uniref:Baseplate J/gp47 family protein n=1 Tax=Pseudomonas aestuarii TaxID=3018340 RepID=A0ABT4XE91_9PSED|nr:baseplate J/gp47 family protein [Pseudomonas aestuarii]MDA7086507.1 baseplate J/gp47 family protein [Pseudomonas aestuarii]